jgi:hypothetical protein
LSALDIPAADEHVGRQPDDPIEHGGELGAKRSEQGDNGWIRRHTRAEGRDELHRACHDAPVVRIHLQLRPRIRQSLAAVLDDQRVVDDAGELDVGVIAENDVKSVDVRGEVDERPQRRVGRRIKSGHAEVADDDEDLSARPFGRSPRLLGRRYRVSHLNRPEAAREHERRRLRVGQTDDRHLHAADIEDRERLDPGQIVAHVLQVGREVRELGQIDQVLEEHDTLVEVVIPEGIRIEPHEVHGEDRWFLVKERRKRWRGPEGVAGGQRQRVGVRGAVGLPVSRELGRPADVADARNG